MNPFLSFFVMKYEFFLIVSVLLSISAGSVYAQCSEDNRDACLDKDGKFDYTSYEDSFWEPIQLEHYFEKNSTVTFEHNREGLGLRGVFNATQEDLITMTVPRNIVDSIHRNCDPDEIMVNVYYDEPYPGTTPHNGKYQDSLQPEQIMNQTHRIVTLKVLPTMSFEFMGLFPIGLMDEMLNTCGAPNGYLTYYAPLKFQVDHQVVLDNIKCSNPEHVLAERPNGRLACVSYETSEKLNWSVING